MTETALPPTSDDGLIDYARTRSPDSFRRLVDRHLPLVYAAARRQVGDPAAAEDVAQAVFLILADKVSTLRPDRPLAPWLLRVTHYAAANARRARARQAYHERKAAEMAAQRPTTAETSRDSDYADWSPHLDEGINRLKRRDRDAIVLRFFERKSNREVAASLGISEPAAAKRIERAVAKLRAFFARRGAAVTAAALATTLAARSTEAAPPHLAASIGTAGATAAGVTSIAKGALIAMTCAKTKTVLISVLAGTFIVGGSSIVLVKTLATPGPAISSPAKPTPSGVGPSVSFSDNSTATVVAVADNPDTGRWWAPDGTPLPTPPAEMPPNVNRIWTSTGNRAYYMVVRHESPSLAGTYLAVGVRQLHQSDGNTGEAFGPNVRVIGYTVSLPDTLDAVDLVLNLSRGPWTVTERYDLRSTPTPGATTSPAPFFRVVSVGEENGNATVTFDLTNAPRPGNGEDQLLLATADGHEISYNSSTSTAPGRVVLRFPVPKSQAVAFLHRWRPFETRMIRNISLRPGTRTDVTPAP